MTPEGRVKQKVKQYLSRLGVWYFCPVSNGMGAMGIPDFVCCTPSGRFVGIETKAPGKRGHTTPLQKHQIAGIQACNGVAVVVDDAKQLEELDLT